MAGPPRREPTLPPAVTPATQRSHPQAPSPEPPGPPSAQEFPPVGLAHPEPTDAEVEARRREFVAALEAFRDTAVLVPIEDGGWLTVDFGGVRWILAFSDEPALARYALARDEGGEEWTYETVLGARLLDAAVPEAGVPCGVALDAADGAEHALLLPPVAGIVPDAYAVDRGFAGEVRRP